MPAVSLPIFSWLTSSALRTAALKAAATRSSSMSLSSASKLGSISMRFTSCLQVIVTLTSPPPDSAVTSTKASSSCAFFRLSCMACACFIRPASCPLLNMGFLWESSRFQGEKSGRVEHAGQRPIISASSQSARCCRGRFCRPNGGSCPAQMGRSGWSLQPRADAGPARPRCALPGCR